MSVSEIEGRAGGGAPEIALLPPRKGRRWRRLLLGVLGLLVVTAVVVLGILAGTYQPLDFGGAGAASFPGLHSGTGIRYVNDFDEPGQIYIPPQRGSFPLVTSIENDGPYTVTIEAVRLAAPGAPAGTLWPLRGSGAVRYRPEYSKDAVGSGTFSRPLALPPGNDILIGIPMRYASSCFVRGGWTNVSDYWVKERFLIFTQWVEMTLPQRILLAEPEPRSAGTYCLH